MKRFSAPDTQIKEQKHNETIFYVPNDNVFLLPTFVTDGWRRKLLNFPEINLSKADLGGRKVMTCRQPMVIDGGMRIFQFKAE
jgi:hypothetical protein